MMYLERNHALFEEMGRSLKPQRGVVVGKSAQSTFTTTGHYESGILKRDSYTGVRETRRLKGDDYMYQAARGLAFIIAIERQTPHLMEELPDFYGLLEDPENVVGILTEDFSEGRKYRVEEVTRPWDMPISDDEIPRELERIKREAMGAHDLATMCFLVNGKRRIGDFGEMFSGLNISELAERFPIEELLGQLDRYTLHIDYGLK